MVALKRERSVGPVPEHDLKLLFEQVHPRPNVRERKTLRRVLALVPAGAESQLNSSARDLVCCGDELGERRGMTECCRRDHRAEPQRRGHRGERVERPPCVKRSALRVHAVEVVVRPEQRRNGMPFASQRERLPLTPSHALLSLDHQAQVHRINNRLGRKSSIWMCGSAEPSEQESETSVSLREYAAHAADTGSCPGRGWVRALSRHPAPARGPW